jgi:hypothetical protein
MTEEQLIASYSEELQHLANDAYSRGLHPIHTANLMMLAAIQISVQFVGVAATREGLVLASTQVGADHIQ